LTKIRLIHSVSYFNFGGLEFCLGELSPPKPPRWRRDWCAGNKANWFLGFNKVSCHAANTHTL